MTALLFFIGGWFGTVWWPGIEVDAPRPGGGDPWWTRWVHGAIGGVAAVAILGKLAAFSEPMPGILGAIAVGSVAAAITRPIVRMVTNRG